MHERNKRVFWSFVAAAFLIVCLPSGLLLQALARYRRFLTGFEPSVLRATRPRLVPHRNHSEPPEDLSFIEFRLREPGAREVFLIGDFNGWKEGRLPLLRRPDGTWELVVPLPRGRHHYLFVVDGRTRTDPRSHARAEVDGRKASVLVVP